MNENGESQQSYELLLRCNHYPLADGDRMEETIKDRLDNLQLRNE